MTFKNLYLGLYYQLPFKRLFRNYFITGNGWGLFYKSSHRRKDTGKEKVGYPTIESAERASKRMSDKYDKHFSVYKCIYCDGFHLGKNNHNK